MESQDIRNKRLAKNTVVLYIRMLFTTVVGLFTSRIVLQQLGIVDYGVYNVVGGVVVMFSFVQTALSNATSRFITVSLGENDIPKIRRTYSTTVLLHLLLTLFVFVIAETIGVWFFYTYLNIPLESQTAAMWAYQLSVITTLLSIVCVPDNSLIIAHERMSAFAYVSIYESLARLGGAYLLILFDRDRLIVYALTLCIIQVSVRVIYSWYCKKYFPESKIEYVFDKKLIKEITVFSSYVLLPGFGAVACAQGLNILLNLFAGPAANAARGISIQIQALLTHFTQSFQQATSPQITKLCASHQQDQMHSLIVKSSKFSFYIMLLPFVPLFYEMNFILQIWLVEVPEYTIEFSRIILFITLLSTLDYPILIAVTAEGHIRKLYTLGGLCSASVVPCAYMALKLGMPIISVYIVHLLIHLLCICLEFKIGGARINFGMNKVLRHIVLPVLVCLLLSFSLSLGLKLLIPSSGFLNFLFVSFLMVVMTAMVIFAIGMNVREREFVVDKLSIVYNKLSK